MRLLTAAISLMVMFCSCTYSINMVHSSGTATDVIDETSSPTATTDIDASLPIPL